MIQSAQPGSMKAHGWIFTIIALATGQAAPAAPDFARDVRPILERSCFGCHGPEKQKSGYRLDIRDIALKGGDTGKPAIVPHNAKASPLIRYVSGEDEEIVMPPRKSSAQRLTAAEVKTLRDWIDAGPAWPEAWSPHPTGSRAECRRPCPRKRRPVLRRVPRRGLRPVLRPLPRRQPVLRPARRGAGHIGR